MTEADDQAISDEAEGAWETPRCIVCGDPLDPKQHRLECDG